jgi:hypothetical protein
VTLLARYCQSLSPALRDYYRASLAPCLLFLALAVAHEWLSRQPEAAPALRLAAALAPAVAMAWLFACYLRFLRDCDELERGIELKALAWAAGITLQGLMTVLFLLDAGLLAWPQKRLAAAMGLLLLASYALVRGGLHRRYA